MKPYRLYLCFLLSAFCFLPPPGLAADATFDSLKPQTTDLTSTPALTAKMLQILYELREALQGIGTNQMRIAGTISVSSITNLPVIDVNPTNSATNPLNVRAAASTNTVTQAGEWKLAIGTNNSQQLGEWKLAIGTNNSQQLGEWKLAIGTNNSQQLGEWKLAIGTNSTTPTQISPVAFSVDVAAVSTCYQITNAVAIRLISVQNTNAGSIYLGFASNGTYQVTMPTGTNTAWGAPANASLYATNLWLGAGASGGTGVVNGVLFY